MNVPTRVGFQTPFTNLTFDLTVPDDPGRRVCDHWRPATGGKYSEFQPEMDLLNRCFAELMLAGDANGRVFTFPIPTYNITPDFDWDNPVLDPIWQMTAKYGIPYFANFVNSDLRPRRRPLHVLPAAPGQQRAAQARRRAVRLQPAHGHHRRGHAEHGPHRAIWPTRAGFFARVGRLMDIAKEALSIRRRVIERFTEGGLYPYSQHYLDGIKAQTGQYWGNHFNTIGLNGMNEACLNFMGVDLTEDSAREFATRVLNFMRDKLQQYQDETGEMYNLEATPAEGTSYRFAMLDRNLYPTSSPLATRARGRALLYQLEPVARQRDR
jgi:ribonucleoside-triphosphate reductase (formate)